MFSFTGNATVQQVNISNVSLIHPTGVGTSDPIIVYETGTQERHIFNITNCYIRQDNTGNGNYVIGTSANYPKRIIIDIRDTWITTERPGASCFNFTTVSSNTDVLALKLRDNTFYAPDVGAVSSNTGFIETRAVQGAEFYWYWQGNTFYSKPSSIASGASIYAWYDAGSSTTACRLTQTTPSIHNYSSYPSPPIINLTPVVMYEQLKITDPQWWNRS
jgi:hypothetical protein